MEVPRAYVVLVATAVLAVLVVQVAVAGSGEGGGEPQANASATVRQQLTKVKRQLKQLRAQVEGISNQQGPQGPPGPPGPSTGPAGGDLTGTYPNPQIAANAVTTGEVLDDSLTSTDLGPGSVGTSEVFNESLLSEDLQTGSVGATELQTGAVASGTVLNNSLTFDDIGPGAVNITELANSAVATQHFALLPTARVRRTTDTNINSNSLLPISFTTETWDPFNMHSPNGNFLNAPVAGLYLITANVLWANDAGADVEVRELSIDVNDAKPIAAVTDDDRASADDFLSLTTVYRLAAGDDVRVKVQQTTGSPLAIVASGPGPETSPEFSMTWLGPFPP